MANLLNYWQTAKLPYPQDGTVITASAAVTAAAVTDGVRVGKGKMCLNFDVTALTLATGETLRVEIQTNKYSNNGVNVSSKIAFDGDFASGDAINITIGGVAAAEVTYATDHATTMLAVVAAVEAVPGISCELDPTDVNGRSILILVDAKTAIGTVTETVVGGGAATGTITYDEDYYTCAVMTFDDAIQGGVTDGVAEYPVIIDNQNDYKLRLKYSIVSTPSVTFSCTAYPLERRA